MIVNPINVASNLRITIKLLSRSIKIEITT